MTDRRSTIVRVLAAAICIAGAGCTPEEPFLVNGDINGAEIRYSTDRTLADNIAQRHCRQYERVARFIGTGDNTAYYECDLH